MGEHHFGNDRCPRDLLGPYVLGESSIEEERELKHHLQQCPECRSDLDRLRQAHEFMRGVPPFRRARG